MNATLGGTPVTIHRPGSGVPFPPSGLLGLDVESTFMTDRGQFDADFRVRTVQLATKDTAWVFDLADDEHRQAVSMILVDPETTFCSHTDMDVLAVWRELGIDITARNVDTRFLATLADPDKDEARDLKTLATNYGMPELAEHDKALYAWMVDRWVAGGGKRNAKRSDTEAAGWNALASMPADEWPEVFTAYAGLDAIACRRLVELLVPATQAPPELLAVDQTLHVKTTRMRLRGFVIDTEALDVLHAEAVGICEEAKAYADYLTDGVNIGGPKILPWLSEHGVDWSTWEGARTDKQNPSLAKENIKLLYDYPLDEVGRAVVDEMVVFKSKQDLMNKAKGIAKHLVMHDDGIARVHPLLNPVGASTTARMSSSGPNLQNASKKDPRMRGLFLPEPGHVLFTADYDQIELRVVAALAREEKMIDVIKAGGDLHQLTADLIGELGVPITRDIAKMTNFLIVYGGGPRALHEQGGVPIDIAKQVIDGFRQQYTAITAYSKWLGMEREAIRTISNRRLPVTRVKGGGDRSGDLRTYANVNYMVQSSAREALVSSWLQVDRKHPEAIWLAVHDELILQVPEGTEAEVMADVEDAMRFDFRGVPISATAVVLRDEDGVSRWMTSKRAEGIEAARKASVA